MTLIEDLPKPCIDYRCERCGHRWRGRTAVAPVRCPREGCRSSYWWRPRSRRPVTCERCGAHWLPRAIPRYCKFCRRRLQAAPPRGRPVLSHGR